MTEFQPIQGKPHYFKLVTDIPPSAAGVLESAQILGESHASLVQNMFRQYDFYNRAVGKGALLLSRNKEKQLPTLHPLAPTAYEPRPECIHLEVNVANFTRTALEKYLGSLHEWKKAWHEAASLNSQVRERKLLGHKFYLLDAATLEARQVAFTTKTL